MITLLGLRQQQLLTLLLRNKEGLTVEDLAKGLGITDNAVRQHLTALERNGIVVKGETQSTGGRPEQLFEFAVGSGRLESPQKEQSGSPLPLAFGHLI